MLLCRLGFAAVPKYCLFNRACSPVVQKAALRQVPLCDTQSPSTQTILKLPFMTDQCPGNEQKKV